MSSNATKTKSKNISIFTTKTTGMPSSVTTEDTQALLSLTSLDTPKYGWSIIGSINNVLPPHEAVRRYPRITKSIQETNETQEKTEQSKDINTPVNKRSFTSKTYHRGEAYKEPRNLESKELLYDLPKSDTNHDYNPPPSIKIKLKFPLNGTTYFKEIISWDFTTTPLQYVQSLGMEYNLNFSVIMDLLGSINTQLNLYKEGLVYYPKYKNALSWVDPHGYERLNYINWNEYNNDSITKIKIENDIANTVIDTIIDSDVDIEEDIENEQTSKKKRKSKIPAKSNIKFETPKVYRTAIQTRAKQEQIQLLLNKSTLQIRGDHICHICHVRKKEACVFACNNATHAYCDYHLNSRLGFAIHDVNNGHNIYYCPICCLHCVCAKCSRKLDSVGKYFSNECRAVMDDRAKLNNDDNINEDMFVMEYDRPNLNHDILTKCTSSANAKPTVNTTQATSTPTSTKKAVFNPSALSIPKQLKKLPVELFPREICNGVDIEPVDSKPTSLSVLHNKKQVTPKLIVEDDGNINYCFKCNIGGELVCCEACPRSFHLYCSNEENDGDFICSQCKLNQTVQDNDIIQEDKAHTNIIIQSISNIKYSTYHTKYVKILSILYSMIIKLSKFDFGYIFLHPITSKDYLECIYYPMDYTTLLSNIKNGLYIKKYTNLEEVIFEILKDIEMIYHNCFLYNIEKSTYWNMGVVQHEKFHQLLQVNIEPLVSDTIKEQYDLFLNRRKNEREESSSKEVEHIIEVPKNMGGTSRIIAVVDIENQQVVKRYTTLKAASCTAVYICEKLGYAPEYHCNLNEVAFKAFIKSNCINNNGKTLYGYRWVYDEDVDNEIDTANVVMPIDNPTEYKDNIEQKQQNDTVEQTSNEQKQNNYMIEQTSLVSNERKLYNTMKDAYRSMPNQTVVSYESFSNLISTTSTEKHVVLNNYKWRCIPQQKCIVKLNIKTNAVMQEYASIQDAFTDWLNYYVAIRRMDVSTMDTSATNYLQEEFVRKFLYGNMIMNDMQWKINPLVYRVGQVDDSLEQHDGSSNTTNKKKRRVILPMNLAKLKLRVIVNNNLITPSYDNVAEEESNSLHIQEDKQYPITFTAAYGNVPSNNFSNTTVDNQEVNDTTQSEYDDKDLMSIVEAMELREHQSIVNENFNMSALPSHGESMQNPPFMSQNMTQTNIQTNMQSLQPSSVTTKIPKRRESYTNIPCSSPMNQLQQQYNNNYGAMQMHHVQQQNIQGMMYSSMLPQPPSQMHSPQQAQYQQQYQQQPLLATNQQQPRLTNNQQQSLLATNQQQPLLATNQQQPLLATNQQQPRLTNNHHQPHLTNTQQQSHLTNNQQQPYLTNNQHQQYLTNNQQQPYLTNDQQQSHFTSTQQQPHLTSQEQTQDLTEDEKSIAISAALSYHQHHKLHKNKPGSGKRPLRTIDISTLTIEAHHDTFSAARKYHKLNDKKITQLIEKKEAYEGKIIADEVDTEKIISLMKNAVGNWRNGRQV